MLRRLFLALVLAAAALPAVAAPSCLPGFYGEPVGQILAKRTSSGWYVGGFCRMAAGGFGHWGIACVHGTCAPVGTFAETVSGHLRSADPASAAASAWDSSIKPAPCGKATGSLKTVCGEMYAALWEARPWGVPVDAAATEPVVDPPPVEAWEVSPIASGRRPSRKVVAGELVAMPTPVYVAQLTNCLPEVSPTFVTTAGTWMAVAGQPADLRWLCRKK